MMFKFIVLYFFADAATRVSSHPLLTTIPQQTCPAMNNQIPAQFPIQMANYIPTHPYTNIVQNPMLLPIHEEPSLTQQISDIFVDRILSDPGIQSIIKQTKADDKNCKDKTTVVNNYIIVPKEYLKDVTKDNNKNMDQRKITLNASGINQNTKNKDKQMKIKNGDSKLDPNQYFFNITNPNEERGKRYSPKGIQAIAPTTSIKGNSQPPNNINKSAPVRHVTNIQKPINTINQGVPGNGMVIKPANSKVENKKTCKAREDKVIAEFKTKFPGIPEDVIKSLLNHLKEHLLENDVTEQNNMYPNFNSPFMFNQFFQNAMFPTTKVENKENSRRRHKSSRKNKNKKRKPKNSITNSTSIETTTEMTPKLETKKVFLTENQIDTEPIYPVFVKDDLALSQSKVDTEQNDENSFTTPDLGKEDRVPISHTNDINDDYFPDFKADNQAYFATIDDSNLRNLDNRYHYTTDKAVLPLPSLEPTDFESKADKNRQALKSTAIGEVANKSNTNSNKFDKEENKPRTVHTLVAQTKVKKYGSHIELTDEATETSRTKFVEDDFENPVQFNSNGDMIVIAKSIND